LADRTEEVATFGLTVAVPVAMSPTPIAAPVALFAASMYPAGELPGHGR
jgi:hypothetical protein